MLCAFAQVKPATPHSRHSGSALARPQIRQLKQLTRRQNPWLMNSTKK
jgi:hypothetical protein